MHESKYRLYPPADERMDL